MKTGGIIGGIGPESTIEYYRSAIAAYREQKGDGSYPSILINSIDLKKVVDLVTANELGQMTRYLTAEVKRLADAGAECGLLAANTPHIVFDEVQSQSAIPLISIVQAVCDAAKTLGLKKIGLFGTRFTMEGDFYPRVFSKEGITLVIPKADERENIHDIYMNELLKGIFLPETRERLLTLVDHMLAREEIQGLILGGTELPLILRDAIYRGIPFLNTTQIHVKALVQRLL
jgi:aspartate racemase